MKRICVFCGSGPGSRPEYSAVAEELAAEPVQSKIGLVCGGGNVGGEPAAGETVTWYQIWWICAYDCLNLPTRNARKSLKPLKTGCWHCKQ